MLKYKLNPVSNSRTAYISIERTEAVAQRRSVTLLYLFIIFILYQYLLCFIFIFIFIIYYIYIILHIIFIQRAANY